MNGFRLISSKTIIGELYSDFNITNDDWTGKAQRHMARALGLMKIDGYYEIGFHMENVAEFNAPLPCDTKYILAVLSNASGTITRLPLTRSLPLGANFSNIAYHNTFKGRINFNTLRTNFETGTVMYIYYRIPKGEDGGLLIPDNDDVLEALPYYLIYKMSLSGYKHPVIDINTADAKWRELYPRARNSMNYPSVEEIHQFTKINTCPLFFDAIDENWGATPEIMTMATTEFIDQLNGISSTDDSIADRWETTSW